MTRILLLLFTLLSLQTLQAQEKYKNAEGFYNLSGFEVSSGLYLLENKTFFYFSSFGNVDLKLYGTYTISKNNTISLNVSKNLLADFFLFGRNNSKLSSGLSFSYYKPYKQNAENIYLISNTTKTPFPKFTASSKSTTLHIVPKNKKQVKIGYKLAQNKPEASIHIADSINEIKIYHNYYAEMTKQVATTQFKINNDKLTTPSNFSNGKTIQKKELSEAVKQQVNQYIEKDKNQNHILRDNNLYYKLELY
ncbi:hypothetical protein GGR32_001997 [Mesonia hippocampi]|uniref:Uncharacterized protein n=1 Tax=Mesonia hippocampi TaxID=1628250 RepID=A0A840ERM6_9FLAO|nr:hypothetical protein [Mesonia hippocampi]MBB4119691.1 hypothetical protein [Mesonia hippocampi]